MKSAGEEEVLLLQPSLLDPRQQRLPGGLGYLELHRALGLVLHDDCARCHVVSVAHVPYPEGNEVATTKLTIDTQLEEGEFTHPVLRLKPDPKRPRYL